MACRDIAEKLLDRLVDGDVEAAGALCHPDLELRASGVGGRPRLHRGPGAFADHLTELGTGWDDVWIERPRVDAAPRDRALAVYWVVADGGADGVLDSRWAAVVRARDGAVWRWEAFQDVAGSVDWLAAASRRGR